MRNRHFLSTACPAIVAMHLLSVSVHPAMAAEAINKQPGGCAGYRAGSGDPVSIPGAPPILRKVSLPA